MNTMDSWQAWLAEFERDTSPEGLAAHVRLNEDGDVSDVLWSAIFHIRNVFCEANAMLLASVQEPAAAAEQALAKIAAAARGVNLGKPPRGLKKREKEAYRAAAREVQPYYAPEADMLQSLFVHYLHDAADAGADANLLMQEACFEIARGRRAQALELAGQAGAVVLRGGPLWLGWTHEGVGDFRNWARALVTLVLQWRTDGLLPLGSPAEERARASERAEALSRTHARRSAELSEETEADAEAEPEPDMAFVEQWAELASREQSLDAGEIQGLGELYDRYVEMSLRVLDATAVEDDEPPPDEMLQLAVASIGVLHCTNEHAIDQLINIVRDDEQSYQLEVIEEALWSLEQVGPAALPAVFDFIRYTGNSEARDDLLDVLGVVGRGSPAVFDFLTGKFLGLSWRDGKSLYIRPLALLGDERAGPMLCDALTDPGLDEDAVWELLDGLEELSVGFSVDISNGNVMIPDYGLIENVTLGDWRPRAEREALEPEVLEQLGAAAETTWQPSADDAVVFDAFGIPHCVDCGAVMHRANGRWEHPFDMDEFPVPQKPARVEQIARNDPCPCGSGKKYKHCHGRPDTARVN